MLIIIALNAEFELEKMNVSGWNAQSITWQGFLSLLKYFYVYLGHIEFFLKSLELSNYNQHHHFRPSLAHMKVFICNQKNTY